MFKSIFLFIIFFIYSFLFINFFINLKLFIMKKILTLVALLTCFMGAKAANWVEVYKIDYSQKTGFPFYVMGYVPEWVDGVMTDFGSSYKYAEVKEDSEETSDVIVKTDGGVEYYRWTEGGGWHQYFICDGIPTQIDGHYKAVAMVKASEPVTINVNMGWGWGDGQQVSNDQVSIGTEWAEVEWEYSGIGGSSCNLVAQPGGATATIEWKSVTVYEDQANVKPVTWQEWLTSDGQPVVVETTSAAIPTWMGNAETPWADPNVKFNDQSQNYLICAWGKEREVNMNDDGGWDPFPATIEEEDGNHYFIVHGKEATTEGDASAWDNQFWIQSPREWKSGDQLKISFRYKASKEVTVATQVHKQNPSDYLIWHAIGDITFGTEWKEFSGTMTMGDDMGGGWSIAFQLNQNDKEAIDFYFDDLSWQSMVLDEGYFVAGCNTNTGLEYDLSNAIEFTEDEDAGVLSAIVGEEGNKDSYVNQIMISTVRGNDAAFKSNTLKPSGAIVNDPDEWLDYQPASLAKLTLPGNGVWKVYLDPDYKSMAFEMIEGEEIIIVPVNPNPAELVINTVERQYTQSEGADVEGLPENIGTDENPWGQPWDNQFWIVANRTLSTGEVTYVSFEYRAATPAKASTQDHSTPGNYLHWAAIGDVNFTEDWQTFETEFTVPSEANNMQSIAFNLSEIKEANTYEIKNVIWKINDGTEQSLINETGTENFFIKIKGVNNNGPFQYGTTPEPPSIPGDVNGDGTVDVADISAIISVMAGTEQYDNADVNQDGQVDVADISQVITIMAEQARKLRAIEE